MAVRVDLRAHELESDTPLRARLREDQRAARQQETVGGLLALPLLKSGERGGHAAVGTGDEEGGHAPDVWTRAVTAGEYAR